ncbi:exonuclease subunit SbcD [Flavobacterium agrisoli]|uniref:Nuclease SbcCD subunit D n=1 Tax=Flavobacterium agrisoli TaxID=2793066 RepID=A0A934PMF7_9FLAO|nr:exonuclease subunit SbcD [Flavobacterium agrisoli]MBK0369940.1 exonuclease SbcCD subunit D C-terminal domain-containing protein [Flavobacterium agrisoli]
MSIKILHTSDWHLGKQLLKTDLHADMDLFFDWLRETLVSEKVDILLMSGDLFDQANPSQPALTQYYQFLKSLLPLQCKVIITGGNHDSTAVLNAPKALLSVLDVHVIGGAPEELSDAFITFEKDNQKVVVAAIPYLRDKDIRETIAGESYDDKIMQIKKGMESYFEQVNQHYLENHPNVPLIIMGHLFAQNAETSESEREIQIGNQAGIESRIFGTHAAYVALGHIHKPQQIGNQNTRYSGSPIPLSFSEREDKKQVILIEVANNELQIETKEIPSFRKLITLAGTLEAVQKKLSDYQSQTPLTDLIEIQIEEENESVVLINALEELLSQENHADYQIVKGKISFTNSLQNTGSLLRNGEEITDFKPIEMFEKRLEQDTALTNKTELLAAFKTLLTALDESEN